MNYLLGDKVERNISFRVFLALVLVILAVSGIDFLFLVLNELSDISDTYNLKELLTYSVMSMPYRLFNLTSYFCLIGVVLGLGALVDDGELIGAKILGKSSLSIAISAFRPVLCLILIGLLACEFVIPNLSQIAEENKLTLQEDEKTKKGYWIESDIGLIFIKSIPEKNELKGLSIFELNSENNVSRIIYAQNASFELDSWKVRNPKITQVNKVPKNHFYDLDQLRISVLESDFSLLLSPKYLSLSELYGQINLTSSKYRKNQLSLEFWRKTLQPLVTFSLVLLALGFVFGPMRDQRSGQRIILGIGVAFTVDLFQKLLGSISVVSSIPPIVAVLVPFFLIVFLASLLLKRVN